MRNLVESELLALCLISSLTSISFFFFLKKKSHFTITMQIFIIQCLSLCSKFLNVFQQNSLVSLHENPITPANQAETKNKHITFYIMSSNKMYIL